MEKSDIHKKIECYLCGSDKIKFYREANGFIIKKCYACGLLWAPDVNANDIEKFYNSPDYFNSKSDMGYHNYLEEEQNHRRNADYILNLLNKFKDISFAKILDFGCAFGFLLDCARKIKLCEVYGVEMSSSARDYAFNKLKLTNIDDDITLSKKETNFFDAVFIIGTIEHLISPLQTLCGINRVLKQGGALVMTTLDIKGILPFYFLKPPEHLFYFNHVNISLLLNKAGFKCLRKKTHFVYYRLYDLLYRLSKCPCLLFLGSFLERLKLSYLNLSFHIPTNEMFIIAEKI